MRTHKEAGYHVIYFYSHEITIIIATFTISRKRTSQTIILILLYTLLQYINAFQLTSSSKISNINTKQLQDFLATPTNWPDIVLSSHSVKCPSTKNNRVDVPLQVGDYVEEVFGLPPLLPLSVIWQCVESRDGYLEFYSENGVPNLANECKMIFNIRQLQDRDDSIIVDLTMEFKPMNPVIPLAIPLLSLDNNLALNVLLPVAIKRVI